MTAGYYNLDVFISGKNSRVLQITGTPSDSITEIQVLRSFSPVNSQSPDDGKLYGEDSNPHFRVYYDDPYSQDNRLGDDTDDWEIIGYLEEGSCIFVDDERLPWNKSRDVYYKMRVYSGESYKDTDIVPAGRFRSAKLTPVMNGLISTLNAEIKINGRSGYLLKARKWGKTCPECRDFGTNRPINDRCPVCFGTGYVGGYYEAIELPVLDEAPKRVSGRSAEDYVESETLSVRCVANPVISRGDIWVSKNTNDRYFIDQCSPLSMYKGIPVVYGLSLKKLAQSDIVFDRPVDDIIEDSYVNWETIGR